MKAWWSVKKIFAAQLSVASKEMMDGLCSVHLRLSQPWGKDLKKMLLYSNSNDSYLGISSAKICIIQIFKLSYILHLVKKLLYLLYCMLCCTTQNAEKLEHSFVMFCAGDSFWPKSAFCFQLAFPLSKFSDRREFRRNLIWIISKCISTSLHIKYKKSRSLQRDGFYSKNHFLDQEVMRSVWNGARMARQWQKGGRTTMLLIYKSS